jgi:hypothetical protein
MKSATLQLILTRNLNVRMIASCNGTIPQSLHEADFHDLDAKEAESPNPKKENMDVSQKRRWNNGRWQISKTSDEARARGWSLAGYSVGRMTGRGKGKIVHTRSRGTEVTSDCALSFQLASLCIGNRMVDVFFQVICP